MIRLMIALACGLALAACTRAVMYIVNEYPPSLPYETVKAEDGGEYHVRRHGSKQKFIVIQSLAPAVGAAATRGATLGLVDMTAIGPQFQSAAQVYAKQYLPGCTISNGTNIDGRTSWEFDYACGGPAGRMQPR